MCHMLELGNMHKKGHIGTGKHAQERHMCMFPMCHMLELGSVCLLGVCVSRAESGAADYVGEQATGCWAVSRVFQLRPL
jgi:hypothetical protein